MCIDREELEKTIDSKFIEFENKLNKEVREEIRTEVARGVSMNTDLLTSQFERVMEKLTDLGDKQDKIKTTTDVHGREINMLKQHRTNRGYDCPNLPRINTVEKRLDTADKIEAALKLQADRSEQNRKQQLNIVHTYAVVIGTIIVFLAFGLDIIKSWVSNKINGDSEEISQLIEFTNSFITLG